MSSRIDPTDEDLALRARSGDDEAFRVLFDRHAPALQRQIRRRLSPMLRRKVDEADIVQMAYLGAHRGLAEFEPRGAGSFRAWLDGIVEHKLLYVVRQYLQVAKRDLQREQTGSIHQRAPALPGREPSPSGVASAGELRERIEAALAELPTHYREVIRLVQKEGRTLAEAGTALGRSTAAAAKLYGRALARLAELVDWAPRRP